MKRIIMIVVTMMSYAVYCHAQQVGAKVSMTADNKKTYTGVITEIKGAMYRVKYDGYDFAAWLNNSQFKVMNQDPQVIMVDPNTTDPNVFEPVKKDKKIPGSGMLEPTGNVGNSSMPSTWKAHAINNKASGPYNAQCTESPLYGVPEFSSFIVLEDKTIAEYITESCLGAAGDAVNSLADLVDEVSKISSEASAAYLNIRKEPGQLLTETEKMAKQHENLSSAASDAYKKTKTLVDNMKTLAEGPELYALSCIWDGVKEYAGTTSGGKILNDLNAIRKTTENFGKAKKAVEAKLDSFRVRIEKGGALSFADTKLFTDWADIKKGITSTTKSVNLLVAYVSNPKKLLPYEVQADMALTNAEAMISSLTGNCQLQECDAAIKDGIYAGQQALIGARRSTAQAHKREDKWRQRINDVVFKSYPDLRNWEHRDSNDPFLDPIKTMYDQYVPEHNERVNGEQQVDRLQNKLNNLGELCTKLQPIANQVNGRIADYQLIYYTGRNALAACNFQKVESQATELKQLENSDCGHFFPTLFDLTYSEDLLKRMREYKMEGKCKPKTGSGEWTLVSTKVTPENPKVTWTHNEWDYNVNGTEAHYNIYDGAYKVDFNWTPPPAHFDKSGFTVEVSLNGKTTNNQLISTGIGISTSGVTSDTPNDQEHRSAMATGHGSVSGSRSVHFTPLPNATDIEVRIGMHWAVEYTYKYHRM